MIFSPSEITFQVSASVQREVEQLREEVSKARRIFENARSVSSDAGDALLKLQDLQRLVKKATGKPRDNWTPQMKAAITEFKSKIVFFYFLSN